jgi:hypothetical protein
MAGNSSTACWPAGRDPAHGPDGFERIVFDAAIHLTPSAVSNVERFSFSRSKARQQEGRTQVKRPELFTSPRFGSRAEA